ncbi:MAG TPA: ankyrin repeat domain-containing protein [Verrucomicrobiae bacterium]
MKPYNAIAQGSFRAVLVAFALAASGVQVSASEVHLAIAEDRVDDAIKLMEADPKLIKDKDSQLNKPLHLAALRGATNVVFFLISKGADVNARNKFGQTPLHRTMINGNLAIAKALVAAGAEVNGRDSQGVTPIHLAAQRRHDEIVRLLLDHKGEYDAHDAFRRRPLHMSIMGSSAEAMAALIKAGADYKFVDNFGNNYLHLAAGGGSPDIVRQLLELKLDVNSLNKDKFTPGHFAAQNGHKETLEALDKSGADFSLRTSSGATPIDLVRRVRPPFRMSKHDDVQQFLESWLSRPTNATKTASSPASPGQ